MHVTHLKVFLIKHERLTAASCLLAHVVNQVDIHSKLTIAVAIENIDELISDVDVNKVINLLRVDVAGAHIRHAVEADQNLVEVKTVSNRSVVIETVRPFPSIPTNLSGHPWLEDGRMLVQDMAS